MSLKLMYLTNKKNIAMIAEKYGVDYIFVDLEINGKEERQGHLDTVFSKHCMEDIKIIKSVLTKSELLVRINPIYKDSEDEINKVIENGADIVMLPFFKTKNEVESFVKYVKGRAKICLLCETPEAIENIDSILSVDRIDYFYIGLNDLKIAYKKTFMFEFLIDGTVEKLCKKAKNKGIPYGFGGIAGLGHGALHAEYIIAEHLRLGSSMVILSRSFLDIKKISNLKEIEETFKTGVRNIREYEKMLFSKDAAFLKHNHDMIVDKIKKIVDSINSKSYKRFSIEDLKTIAKKLLLANKLSEKQSDIFSDCIIQADACGITSHGLTVLPAYIKKLQNGSFNLNPKFNIIREGGAFSVIDADNAIGTISAVHCMKYAIEMCKKTGIFTVLSRNSNTYGPAFYYPLIAAQHGLIGITFCNSPAAMSAWGGKGKLLGTNPFAIVVPCKNEDFIIFDMATSKVAKSKINEARQSKNLIPLGWALDESGNATTDPLEAIKGTLLPIEGPKGYGLALTIDLLAGALSGAAFLSNVGKFYSEGNECMNVGQTFIAIDPKQIYGDNFFDLMDDYVSSIRNSQHLENSEIKLPGDNKHSNKKDSIINGIKMHPKTIETLNICLKENKIFDIIL